MKPGYGPVQTKIAAIEAEMKRLGWWQDQPLKPEQYDFHQAFAMDTLTFTQWLQFIFIPRVNDIIASQGVFPDHSMVATQAVREFDGIGEASNLVRLLSEFDALFS
jgi:uncharacterized protein YqcC (DUF446 family)